MEECFSKEIGYVRKGMDCDNVTAEQKAAVLDRLLNAVYHEYDDCMESAKMYAGFRTEKPNPLSAFMARHEAYYEDTAKAYGLVIDMIGAFLSLTVNDADTGKDDERLKTLEHLVYGNHNCDKGLRLTHAWYRGAYRPCELR